jgi:hypothetical protein
MSAEKKKRVTQNDVARRANVSNAVVSYVINGGPRPTTAIFAANDSLASGALAALQERGLRVRDDVAVIGYDDDELVVERSSQPLTTMRLPSMEMGQRAAEFIYHNGSCAGGPVTAGTLRSGIARSCYSTCSINDTPRELAMARTIIHLDLDAFFCACEEQRDPSLSGRAFAVGGRPEGRGVVSSAQHQPLPIATRLRCSFSLTRHPLKISHAQLEDAPAILALQYRAYQHEAALYHDPQLASLTEALAQAEATIKTILVSQRGNVSIG